MSDRVSYLDAVGGLAGNPEQLEQLYREAQRRGDSASFVQAIHERYEAAPDNLLYGAWFHRLKQGAATVKRAAIAWAWVIPLAVLNGLLFWALSDDQRFMIEIVNPMRDRADAFLPVIFMVAAPLSAVWLLLYLTVVGHQKQWRRALLIGAVLLMAAAYVLMIYPRLGTQPFQEQYVALMVPHLALLAWVGVGAFLLAGHRDATNRFAFLSKSLELFVMGGLFLIAGALFTGISVGLFEALNLRLPTVVMRLLIAGGAGLIPLIAAAVIYNPAVPPAEQPFDEGLSRLLALLMRVLLPLTLLVLLIYCAFIPFRFREPFENRDVLVIYNGMLFAVLALLVGATPVRLADLSPQAARWLRRAIVAVAVLAFVISLYALAAILYRSALHRLTPNRLTFIGWNLVNIVLLGTVLALQLRARGEAWLHNLHRAFSVGTVAYALWAVAMIVALPWLFSVDQGTLSRLPESVQRIAYERADPILLKCSRSPHIYLLADGEKHWVRDIETFTAQGFLWGDVSFVPCDDLASVPAGTPIPADAGSPPPQP